MSSHTGYNLYILNQLFHLHIQTAIHNAEIRIYKTLALFHRRVFHNLHIGIAGQTYDFIFILLQEQRIFMTYPNKIISAYINILKGAVYYFQY